MSIRTRAGEWQPLMLGVEPELCGVCGDGLSRNFTLLRGGWERCTLCERFVHHSCLVSGKVSFLKIRPRICLSCRPDSYSSESTTHNTSHSTALKS